MGALRAAAQMISYEVSIGLIIISTILITGSLNLTSIINTQVETIWFIFPLLPAGVMFLVSCLAETNRAPFDLTEGESELVSGYNVEYPAMSFALFFLAEYSHIIFMSLVILFFLKSSLIQCVGSSVQGRSAVGSSTIGNSHIHTHKRKESAWRRRSWSDWRTKYESLRLKEIRGYAEHALRSMKEYVQH